MHADRHVVTVVIPTLGRGSIARTLDALDCQTRQPDEVLQILDQDRRGVAWGRNEGIRRAKGDLIAFTDDDCVPGPQWLATLIDAIDRYEADGAGGNLRESDPLLRAIQQGRRAKPDTEQVDSGGLVGTGGNIMFRRRCLDATAAQDGFVYNESFSTAEDWELVYHLRSRGTRLVYVPFEVDHLRTARPWSYLRYQYSRGIGIAALYFDQRRLGIPITPHESLLWGKGTRRSKPRWAAIFWNKIVGPFNWNAFDHWPLYALFWLGQKIQGLGFLWGLVRVRRALHFRAAPHNAMKSAP
ncbi:MAG TPA: glycosyltransferase [Gemmatimonadales bacterium]|nr:glycosyltransferase [Gemmatimonadales bacterium]